MYFGDKVPYPFYLGSGYAGNLIDFSDGDNHDGLYLPESAIAKLPKTEKREIGFNAAQIRVQQESNLREHQDRDGRRQAAKAGRSDCDE